MVEQSAGGVLFTEREGRRLYVLVEEKDGHIGLPKGHVEPGETLTQTALREIREETGLRAEVLPLRPLIERYPLPMGGSKEVTYFYCRFERGEPRADPTQVRRVLLSPYREAVARLTFSGARDVLRLAEWTLNRL
ncbi:MAG: NUDIX domain-containing protein [Clostridia bacterium]|nr:NUDIX domain-containing protein [Clostridia bacterium]